MGRFEAGSISCVWILMLFVALFGVVLNVPSASGQSGTIYIRADGSIDPLGAPISTVDNVTYTLTDNIVNAAPSDNATAIIIERNNTVLNGAGYTLQGTYASYSEGIELSGRSNVTVKNITIKRFYYGVCLSVSFGNIVTENNITANNEFGVMLDASSSNTVSENSVTYGNYAGIYLYNSSNNIVSGNNLANNYRGVYFSSSYGNIVTENNVTYNNYAGVIFYYSSFNIVSGNSITNNYRGIDLWQSSSNIVSGNNIVNNTGASNNGYGIYIASSSGNSFYHNNFVNNTKQVHDYGLDDPHTPPSSNVWDNDYPSGGNYWSNYTGVDIDMNGIGDIAYTIDANNIDRYPSMGMFHSYNVTYFTLPMVGHFCEVTVISNSTISGFFAPIWLEHPEIIGLTFSVTGTQGSAGFCRVSFPTAMMNGTYHVSVNGTEVPYILLPCSNADYSYLYFTYTHSTEGVIITPEFPLFLILPIFMLATLVAVILYKKRMQKSFTCAF